MGGGDRVTLLDHIDPLFRPILTGWNTNTAAEVWHAINEQLKRLCQRIDRARLCR